MARIDIPKPISTYKNLGTVELAKLARNQYIEGYGAADEFSNSVNNMQALEKDQHIKTRLSNEYTGMLDKWSSRGDYETLGIAISKGANQFVQDYNPVQQSVKNRSDYAQSLKDAYEKGDININTYRGRLAQSDSGYQGIQYGEDGSLQDNSVYNGKNFNKDVDITEKINKRLKEVEPFIRQNLGTDIPHNEDMEVTSTTGARGEVKYWVRTKSKTVELPSNIIQMVVNDVMSDPDVSASLAQEIDINTYQLGDEGAMEHITKLLESGDLKEEDLTDENGNSLIETMGPLVALQNILYQNSVNRETQLAVGSFGGVRESSYGQTISYDEMYKINEKAKIKNTKKLAASDDLSYDVAFQIAPTNESYEDAVQEQQETVNLIKGNLNLVSGQLNVDPDKIEYDEQGNEVFGSGGQGLDLEGMNTSEIIQNTESLVDGWNNAKAQANTQKLGWIAWKQTVNTLQPKVDTKGNVIEDQSTYLARLDKAYEEYETSILNTRKVGSTYLNNVAASNDLDIDKFNSTMHILSGQVQDYDVTTAKINSPIPGLSVPNSEGYNNLTIQEYVEARGDQLANAEFTGIGGDDWTLNSELQLLTGNNPLFLDNVEVTITGQDIVDAHNALNPNDPIESLMNLTGVSNINSGIPGQGSSYDTQILKGKLYQIMMKKHFNKDVSEFAFAFDQRAEAIDDILIGVNKFLKEEETRVQTFYDANYSGASISMEGAVMTNFGSRFETTSIVNKQLKDFFKDDVIPSNWSLRDAQGQSPNQEFEGGFLNSQESKNNHFGYTVEYDIIEEQMGVLNMQLGDEGAMVYVPIKITNSPKKGEEVEDLKGKVFNYLVPASYFTLPALSEYINSPEMEVNTQWNKGVSSRIDKWSPSQYSNVTFIYDRSGGGKDEVIIAGERHSKQKGLAILVQNLLNNRSRSYQE
tara:strand:+ start:2152 stop:4920 length:2769 start_codon:yes stop_codon:yes gene_type:complete